MSIRVGVFASHPIQYFSPMFVRLAAMPDIDLLVHYFSDHSIRGGTDRGFGQAVKWDVPLLDGYTSVFLQRDANLASRKTVRISDPETLLRQGKFDVVMIYGHSYGFEQQLATTCRKLGIPIVLRGEFTDKVAVDDRGKGRPWYKTVLRDFYLRSFYRKISRFCYIGQHAKNHLHRLGIPNDRMVFSPYAVNDDLLQKQQAESDRDAARASLTIEPSSIALLFSGKLVARKNPLLLVQAIDRMKHRDRIHLLMLGSGELVPQVRSLAEKVLGPRGHLAGFVNQSELGRYFSAADVLVMPSLFESWGLVVNEGMLFGLPVVCSSNVGAAEDLVTPDVTGWTFANGSVDDLARVLDHAVELGHSGLAAMKPTISERIAQYSLVRAVEGVRQAVVEAAAEKRPI